MKHARLHQDVDRRGRAALVSTMVLVPCLLAAPALSAAQHFDCKRVSGGPMSLWFTIDYAAKTIDVSPDWLQPLPDSLEITDAQFEWIFMRGTISLDRKTLALQWDDTAEYDYLEQIDQPATEARDTFKGRMQCVASGK